MGARRSGGAGAVLVGLVLGLGFGIVFGDLAGVLQPVADAFIRLLQMAVLPYVTVSLIAAIGRLSSAQARFVARTGGAVLLAAGALVYLLVVAMPLALPAHPAGFYSTTIVEPRRDFDLLGLYISDNPFRSLSDNVVPAVVLFCLAVGVALIGVPGRERLIGVLDVATGALERVNRFVVRLMPFGVFVIMAAAAGTLGIAEVGRIEAYLVVYVVLACFATFWLLPAFVAALTPLRTRDLLHEARALLVTAFSTGSLLVVLPQIAQAARRLVADGADDEETLATIDVVVPVSFNFPHAGKLLTLGFVVFAAWFAGTPLDGGDLVRLGGLGVLAIFGSMNVALPFLLDAFAVPADLFQLFVVAGVCTFRFQTLLGAMHTLVVTVLSAMAVRGRLAVHWTRVARYAFGSALGLGLVLAAVRGGFAAAGGDPTAAARWAEQRGLLGEPAPAEVLAAPLPARPEASRSVLARAAGSGVLRVGYEPDRLPFSYRNDQGELVGFDVELAHRLARELGVRLAFTPVDRRRLAAQLASGEIDLAIGGLEVTTELSRRVALSDPYVTLTMAFVVEDARRREFTTRAAVRSLSELRVGIVLDHYYEAKLRAYLPQAQVVRVGSVREFFEGGGLGLDALVDAAEVGAAWSLRYPKFTVAVPEPDRLEAPVAFAVAPADNEFRVFLNTWLLLKQEDRTIDRLRRYWIDGRDERPRRPRWSVVRDVLHWVE